MGSRLLIDVFELVGKGKLQEKETGGRLRGGVVVEVPFSHRKRCSLGLQLPLVAGRVDE